MLYAALVSSMQLVAFAADYGGWQYQSYSYDYGDDDYAADYVTQARDQKFVKLCIFENFKRQILDPLSRSRRVRQKRNSSISQHFHLPQLLIAM